MIQKKEYDSMISRLGVNIQDALIKIRNDIKIETRDQLDSTENRLTNRVTDIGDDLHVFRSKWDKDFQGFKLQISRQVDETQK